MRQRFYIVSGADNCAVALDDLRENTPAVSVGAVKNVSLCCAAVPKGHKLALTAIEEGESVFKNACAIGIATERIDKGSWIHLHNLRSFMEEANVVS